MVEFDENFPLSKTINDNDKRLEAIFKIIKTCYMTGAPPPINILEAEDLDLNVTDFHIKEITKLYQQQTPQILSAIIKEPDVMYFLSASRANNNFPVLPTMVDCFTFSTIYIFNIYNNISIICLD